MPRTYVKETMAFHNGVGKNKSSTHGNLKLDHCLPLCIKINSRWFKDLHRRPENLKLLEEKKIEGTFKIWVLT